MAHKGEDIIFMREALREARKAAGGGEVPVGAVAVEDGRIIGRAHNTRETTGDPLGHAEILLVRGLTSGSNLVAGWRMSGVTVYVTLEPCIMCMGALLQARIKRLVFGAFDPKAGVCGSLYNLAEDRRFNHHIDVTSGVLGDRATALLRGFFKKLRV